jgi:isocitrate dehydrogenase
MYWARELASQDEDSELAERFSKLADQLEADEEKIVEELNSVQGSEVDLGGYYRPDEDKMKKAMRPSATLNDALDQFADAD